MSSELLESMQALCLEDGKKTTDGQRQRPHGAGGSPSAEDLQRELERDFLTPPTTFNTEWLNKLQQRWETSLNDTAAFSCAPTQTRTVTRFKREGLEGRVTGYYEATVPAYHATAKNSTSFLRKPANRADFVRGAAGFFPFEPGGLDGIQAIADLEDQSTQDFQHTKPVKGSGLDHVISLSGGGNGLLEVAPGLARGLDWSIRKASKDANLAAQVEQSLETDDRLDDEGEQRENGASEPQTSPKVDQESEADQHDEDIDSLLPVEFPALLPHGTLSTSNLRRGGHQWAHMVDVNREMPNFRDLVPEMARDWPFELDTFQKEAVYHLESGDSVFVAAHTSAGKTVVAEYAIALAAKHMTKAIYTSPIKALSNQKFRDFRKEFEDVGILTGDVQINPEASCLIMTTEILRSMLYRGADIIRDVEYVIFDEVHYVNDFERGVVWEEVIIMLPEQVTLILLSATVPNTYEFASWVGRTKKKNIYVISTPKRPVPLEHYLWADKKTHKIVNAEKKFLEQGWKDANDALSGRSKSKPPTPANAGAAPAPNGKSRGSGPGPRGGQRGQSQPRGGRGGNSAGGSGRGQPARGRGPTQQGRGNIARTGRGAGRTTAAQDRTVWTGLVQYLRKEDLLPACIFVFSKRRCEENADALARLDFCTASEKSAIHMTVERSIARLKPEDRQLPQIRRIRELLSRGIAVHHGGLLPIVKEIVEILFARTLVKVLFATETFAMGLNLPTRTVVFSGFRKHDGRSFRDLLPGEYTQMAGRAGRRGLDPVGNVIIVAPGMDEAPPVLALRQMMLGNPTKLRSQFRLTYNMILNLLRVEALKIEEMIKRSFSENATQALLPEHEKQVKISEANLAKIKREECAICDIDLERCHDAAVSLQDLTANLHRGLMASAVGRRLLAPKRLIVFRNTDGIRTAGIILGESLSKGSEAMIEVVSFGTTVSARTSADLLPYTPRMRAFFTPLPNSTSQMTIKKVAVPLAAVECVTTTMIKISVPLWYLQIQKESEKLGDSVLAIFSDWTASAWDELDWFTRIREVHLQEILQARRREVQIIDDSQCISCPQFVKHFAMCHDEWLIKENITQIRQLMSDQNLQLLPDYEQRVQVLKDLGFVDDGLRVELKGKVACEIHSADELVLTELILENVLADMEPEEIVALLSAFVFQEKTDVEPQLTSSLETGRDNIVRISEKVNNMQIQHQVILSSNDANDFVSQPRFGLVEVVYEWARGMSFNRITDLTDVLEGTIVRVITRLDETCREVKNAARIIGNPKLYTKMQSAQEMIKRDITAVASLYM